MFFKTAACALCAFLTCPAAEPPGPQSSPLKIVVLQGEGAVNNIKTRTVTEPVVEVRDDRELPVAGADVVFQLPPSGPGGLFPDHGRTFATKTNSQGQAAAQAFVPNGEAGRYNIRVTATKDAQTASLIISQRSSVDMASEGSRSGSKKWKILAIVGGAALSGGIILATRGGNSPKPVPNSLAVTPGTITIGSPH